MTGEGLGVPPDDMVVIQQRLDATRRNSIILVPESERADCLVFKVNDRKAWQVYTPQGASIDQGHGFKVNQSAEVHVPVHEIPIFSALNDLVKFLTALNLHSLGAGPDLLQVIVGNAVTQEQVAVNGVEF